MRIWLCGWLLWCCVSVAQAADKPVLKLGWTAWSDAEVVTRLAARLLQERLDQPVELLLLDIGIQYQGLANGDIDAMLMAWLPTTHKPYLDKLGGRFIDLGPLYTGARLGWVVPAYIPAAELGSLADLEKPAIRRRLGGRIQGIDPGAGLMQASEQALQAYGLDRYRLVSASGAGLTAALARAIRRQDWIVVTGWSPHWMFSRWPLRYLEDPRNALGGREQVHALVRLGFGQDFPAAVTDFLTRMFIPLEELEAVMAQASEGSYDAAVEHYIQTHPQRVHYWVTGEL